jgi:hypothetical protein
VILALDRLWINRLDTWAGISGFTDPGRTQEFETGLTVRQYANGRNRAISAGAETGSVAYTLVQVDQATKDLLRTWAGMPVQVRDHRGQKWFGAYKATSVREYVNPLQYAVTITIQMLTITEGV